MFLGLNGFELYAKNAVPYFTVQVSEFRKSVFERVVWIFVLPPTTATRKHVNSRGHVPPKCCTPKNTHFLGST